MEALDFLDAFFLDPPDFLFDRAFTALFLLDLAFLAFDFAFGFFLVAFAFFLAALGFFEALEAFDFGALPLAFDLREALAFFGFFTAFGFEALFFGFEGLFFGLDPTSDLAASRMRAARIGPNPGTSARLLAVLLAIAATDAYPFRAIVSAVAGPMPGISVTSVLIRVRGVVEADALTKMPLT